MSTIKKSNLTPEEQSALDDMARGWRSPTDPLVRQAQAVVAQRQVRMPSVSTIKTESLTPAQINMLVALAEGWAPPGDPVTEQYRRAYRERNGKTLHRSIWLTSRNSEATYTREPFDYCRVDTHAGPIIDRERIGTVAFDGPMWCAFLPGKDYHAGDVEGYGSIDARANDGEGGNTRLEAAMRAYVRKRYGDAIDTTDKPWLLEAAAS